MIISASRRTDIPAFYGEWMINRLRAGFCRVANPFNPTQVSRVSLAGDDVDAIVFWTKDVGPFLPRIADLERLGHPYCFLYTLNDYPSALEPNLPPFEQRLAVFRELSARIGPERVSWRYDPIVLSERMDAECHRERFRYIAKALSGATHRVIVSLVDFYRKTERRLREVEQATGDSFVRAPTHDPCLPELADGLVRIASECGMRIQSCAEDARVTACGIEPGACIDGDYLQRVFGIDVPARKDRGQREACRCVASRDIGATDSCLHGCAYCYSTRSHAAARARHARHDPRADMLAA